MATNLANELAVQGSAALLMPHIKGRLAVEIATVQPKTVVIGQDGKAVRMTVTNSKRVCEQPGLRAGDRGSKATGGGPPVPMVVAVVPSKPFHAPNSTRMDPHAQKQHALNGGKVTD